MQWPRPIYQSFVRGEDFYDVQFISKKNSLHPDAPRAFYASEEQGAQDVNSSSG